MHLYVPWQNKYSFETDDSHTWFILTLSINAPSPQLHVASVFGWPWTLAGLGWSGNLLSLACHYTDLWPKLLPCWSASFYPTTAPMAKCVMHERIHFAAITDTHIRPNCFRFVHISQSKGCKVGYRTICWLFCHLPQGAEIKQATTASWLGFVLPIPCSYIIEG